MERLTYPNPDRVGRLEFVTKTILGFVCFALPVVVLSQQSTSLWGDVATAIFFPLALYLMVSWLFFCARRLHDFGRSGWWVLGCIVGQNIVRQFVLAASKGLAYDIWSGIETAIVLVFLVWVACWPGNRERNEYGYPPEYPPTRLGRLGLANIKRRRAWIIAIWTLVSLIAGVVSYFSSEGKSAQSTEEVVNKTLSNLVLQNCPAVENVVWLGDVQEFDVPQKDEPVPMVDAKTISGDDFA